MTSVYYINKNVGRPIEFKGLKAQYIWWLAIGLTVILIVFALLYLVGVGLMVLVPLAFISGFALFIRVYGLSRTYGEHGLMKKMAAKKVPKVIKAKTKLV